MDHAPDTLPSNDADSSLLEGLFQLALNGQTGSSDFELIDHEVYARLLSAYGADKRFTA
jgi:hypothetical protein